MKKTFFKKTFAVVLAATVTAAIACVSASALSAGSAKNAPALPQTASVQQTAVSSDDNWLEPVTILSNDTDAQSNLKNCCPNSTVFNALYNTIDQARSNGAVGYTICELYGTRIDHLIISYGIGDSRYYDVFKINSDGVTNVGRFGGAHTVLYTDPVSNKLCLLYTFNGNFAYEKVTDYGAVNLQMICGGRVQSGDPYPTVPGTIVSLFNINDLSGIINY